MTGYMSSFYFTILIQIIVKYYLKIEVSGVATSEASVQYYEAPVGAESTNLWLGLYQFVRNKFHTVFLQLQLIQN